VDRGQAKWKKVMGDGSRLGLLAEDEAEEALDREPEAGESDPEVVQTMDWGEWEPTIEPRGLGGGETERAAQGLVVEAEGERGKLPPERDKDVREGGEAREAEGEGADKAMPPSETRRGATSGRFMSPWHRS